MQELRDYFRDLCECLKDKAPIIEELEVRRCRLESVVPRVELAWFQRLKLRCDKSLYSFASNFKLHRYMEEHVQRLNEQRGTAAAEAAAAEEQDEAAGAAAAVEAAQAALMRGASVAEAVSMSAAAALSAAMAGPSGAAELDEFGRDVNLAKRAAAERRSVGTDE